MDTVLGCEGSKKVLLTLHFDCCSLMMAYLLDSKEVCHVKAIFDSIERSLGTFSFSSVFSLVLTDRGGEFRNPAALECGQENLIRTSIYYCDPMCSWQKPHCEKNHEYSRKICPKGTSFDDYSLAMSKTPHTQYLCMFARHGNLFYHSKFIVTTSSKWYN